MRLSTVFVLIYMSSPSYDTPFLSLSSCLMRIARLPFDEDLVTETFLLRFAISEFTIVLVWNYAVYLSSPGIYTFFVHFY